MRNLLFLSLILSATLFSCNSNEYKITGQFENDATGQVYLSKITINELVPVDTARFIDGNFTFKGKNEIPEMFLIQFENYQEYVMVFVENKSITVSGNTDNLTDVKIKGSKLNDIYYDIIKGVPHQDEMQRMENDFFMAQMTGDQATMESILADSEILQENIKDYFLKNVRANYGNPAGAFIAFQALQMFSFEEFEEIIEGLNSNLKEHPYTIELNNYFDMVVEQHERQEMYLKMMEMESNLEPGNEAPNFILTDINGKEVDLKSFRGKYVYIDFWAAWCRPCREENPNLVKIYKTFGGKNFEIIGISTNESVENWKKAVKDDGLTWTQLYDETGEVSEKYLVKSLPNTWLLDKEGKILKKNIRGEELINALKELKLP